MLQAELPVLLVMLLDMGWNIDKLDNNMLDKCYTITPIS